MSDTNTNATVPQETNPLTSLPAMSSTPPSNATSSPITTAIGTGSDNLNEQAEHGNGSTTSAAGSNTLQRRETRAPSRTPTLLEGAATDGQAPGSFAPTHVMNDPIMFGVPRTDHHMLPFPDRADNLQNFGISSADDLSRLGQYVDETSHSMEHSTSSETMTTSSNLPPAEAIDDSVPSEGTVLRDLSCDLDEWPSASDNEVRRDGNMSAQDSLAPPVNEVAAMNIANSRPNTPVTPANSSLLSRQAYLVPNRAIPSGRVEQATSYDGLGTGRVSAFDALERGTGGHLDPLSEEEPSSIASVEGSTPNNQTEPTASEFASELSRPTGHSTLYGITVTQDVSVTVMDLHQGAERSSSNGNTLNMDHVQENALEGRGYSIGVNNHDRRAPGLVGSLRRMSQEEVQEF